MTRFESKLLSGDFFISFIASKLTEQEVLVQTAMGILYFLNPSIKQFMPGFFQANIFRHFDRFFVEPFYLVVRSHFTNFIVCLTDLSRGMENVRM